MTIKLRPYQETGVKGIRDSFKKNRSVLFCLSTGGGKTYTFSYIADSAMKKYRRVMILVHRKELLEQASKSLKSLGVNHGLISPNYTPNRRELVQVASVDTVAARFKKFQYETDLLIVDECFIAGTLIDGKPIETLRVGDCVTAFNEKTKDFEKKKIVRLYKNNAPDYMVRVCIDNCEPIFCTKGHPFYTKRGWINASELTTDDDVVFYNTNKFCYWVRLDSIEIFKSNDLRGSAKSHFDGYVYNIEVEELHTYIANGVVVHNCHHVTESNKWGKVYELLGKPHMLGVTATPVRADGIGLGVHAGGLFEDMVIGPSTPELIEMGFLVKPEVYTSLDLPDVSGVKKTSKGDYNTEQLAEAVDRPRITGNAVEQYSKICPGSKAIVFCININHARHVMSEFNAAGYRFALLVGAPAMSTAERDEVNAGLASGKYHGACTVDLVSEGYDLPALQTCIMLRPTTSESLYLQQVGRIMRPFEGEIKYLLDHVGNVGSFFNGEFKRKHGLPQEERQWTLDGRKKRSKKATDEDEIKIKQCERCYLVHEPAPQCPHCGFLYPIIERRNIEQVDGELKKINEEIEAQIKRDNFKKQGQAQTVEQLMELGNSKYHAQKILAGRREKQELISNVIADLTKWQEQTRDQPFKRFGVTYGSVKTLKPKQLRELHEQIKQEIK